MIEKQLSVMRVLCLFMLLAGLSFGCARNFFIVPTAAVKHYDEKMPLQVGLLMNNQLRRQWYSRREVSSGRLDVPIGEVVENHAHALLSEAFEDFYIIRYPHRRSETGILLVLNTIKFMIIDDSAYVTLNITIENALGQKIKTSDYFGIGTTGVSTAMKIRSRKVENALAESTRLALYWALREVLLDINTLLSQDRI